MCTVFKNIQYVLFCINKKMQIICTKSVYFRNIEMFTFFKANSVLRNVICIVLQKKCKLFLAMLKWKLVVFFFFFKLIKNTCLTNDRRKGFEERISSGGHENSFYT